MATKPKKSAATPVDETAETTESVEAGTELVTVEAAPAEPVTAPIVAKAAAFSNIKLDELAAIHRENMSAAMKAGEALSEGIDAIGKELVGYARTDIEQANHAATALLGAKTLEEVVQLNTDIARTGLELLLKRSAKLSEMGLSVATQTLAPLGGRVEAVIALATKAKAA